jgi:hypothetical protein
MLVIQSRSNSGVAVLEHKRRFVLAPTSSANKNPLGRKPERYRCVRVSHDGTGGVSLLDESIGANRLSSDNESVVAKLLRGRAQQHHGRDG